MVHPSACSISTRPLRVLVNFVLRDVGGMLCTNPTRSSADQAYVSGLSPPLAISSMTRALIRRHFVSRRPGRPPWLVYGSGYNSGVVQSFFLTSYVRTSSQKLVGDASRKHFVLRLLQEQTQGSINERESRSWKSRRLLNHHALLHTTSIDFPGCKAEGQTKVGDAAQVRCVVTSRNGHGGAQHSRYSYGSRMWVL